MNLRILICFLFLLVVVIYADNNEEYCVGMDASDCLNGGTLNVSTCDCMCHPLFDGSGCSMKRRGKYIICGTEEYQVSDSWQIASLNRFPEAHATKLCTQQFYILSDQKIQLKFTAASDYDNAADFGITALECEDGFVEMRSYVGIGNYGGEAGKRFCGQNLTELHTTESRKVIVFVHIYDKESKKVFPLQVLYRIKPSSGDTRIDGCITHQTGYFKCVDCPKEGVTQKKYKYSYGDCGGNAIEIEEKACQYYECGVKKCTYSEWSDDERVNCPCGQRGVQYTRRRTQTEVFDDKSRRRCGDRLEKSQTCLAFSCPVPIDCVISDWMRWTECSRTCGLGHSERQRAIKVLPGNGGAACPDVSFAEFKSCVEMPCPVPKDCEYSDWRTWSGCDGSCGTSGTKIRKRTIEKEARDGGASCNADDLDETTPCDTLACDTTY